MVGQTVSRVISMKSFSLLPSRQELALILVTVFWGGTFFVVHLAMQHAGPLFFVGLRFSWAGLLSLALCRGHLRGLTRRELWAGFLIGVSIFLGYGLQTYGLQTITGSQSAFITALYVPMVPLVQWLVMGRPPHLMSWLGIFLAFTGLICLSGPQAGSLSFGPGEIATLLCAVAVAGEILLIGRFAGRVDSRRVTVVQLLVAGGLALLSMPIAGEAIPAFSWYWALPVLVMGVMSMVIQFTMNWAQKTVSPTRATVIYAGEPVWGGVVGRIAGDRLPALAILGGALIVAGVLVSELKFAPKKVTAPVQP
ncbi:drug/metabolite transporter (DMT)-like permease [Silvimonas terrae]|uniref:Drug/metabolite transporter (DMT)-like permease n=1 Tax=Silvimonas terrae TaxID=300266 RepID=A0A840RJE1_9NEIS|nr:DMT family transporter [Silvimonas terrae]MBB5192704.1 drug/metabolite transporter (DMT)-like permease [Silvimonas terrae]